MNLGDLGPTCADCGRELGHAGRCDPERLGPGELTAEQCAQKERLREAIQSIADGFMSRMNTQIKECLKLLDDLKGKAK